MPLEWLDAHANAVQALAAVGTFVLTLVLAGVTAWYAKSARDQARELEVARTANIEPYVRVVGGETEWEQYDPISDIAGGWSYRSRRLLLRLWLANMGPGPALQVHCELLGHLRGIKYDERPLSLNIAAGSAAAADNPFTALVVVVDSPHLERMLDPESMEVHAWLHYRDLLEREWITDTNFVLTLEEGDDRKPPLTRDRVEFELVHGETRKLIGRGSRS